MKARKKPVRWPINGKRLLPTSSNNSSDADSCRAVTVLHRRRPRAANGTWQCFCLRHFLLLLLADTEAELKSTVLYASRVLEMLGYSISFASVLASLFILSQFR